MKNNQNDFCIEPVESYDAPKIPTLANDKSALLKKLPSRWQKNAKVVACIGLMGALTLPSFACNNDRSIQDSYNVEYSEQSIHNGYGEQAIYNGYSEYELLFRLHGGGAGSSFYVVYFTEQEAFNLIRSQLEAAGLNFDARPPDFSIDFSGFGDTNNVDLFDDERNVAITHITREQNNQPFFSHGGSRLADNVRERFTDEFDDITFGVFFTPEWFPELRVRSNRSLPSARQMAAAKNEARPILEAQLAEQVQTFIDYLRTNGII